MKTDENVSIRDTEQLLISPTVETTESGTYNLFPSFAIGEGKIERGYAEVATKIAEYSCVVIDGYIGVLWDNFRDRLEEALENRGISSDWIDISDSMLPEEQIIAQKKPFLGGDDPIFGTRYIGNLSGFYDSDRLRRLQPSTESDVCILYGCGASLAEWDVPVVYVDLPKNELQYRSRAGRVTNLGRSSARDPKSMYKEFYFVDWVVLNKHKASLVNRIDWIVDEQHPNDTAIMSGNDFRQALETMSKNVFRVRPWFEPGVWGGQWCKQHIPQLPQNVPNYAWSFEMIVPENGIVLSSGDHTLEATFDWLMYYDHEAILGDSAVRFGYEFPIRFDFLDTYNGGNLSLQCHPRPGYIKSHFGESFTQDETYYILDCEPDAKVYLGFRQDIDPKGFRKELEKAARDGSKMNVTSHVLTHQAQKHKLFLIPSGTIHCSGTNNLVLEISATPYIFTFKMYDWQRLDLDGNPRPLNIERAFENLRLDRKGLGKIENEFISTPQILEEKEGWKLIHLPTHPEHFYDIHRYEFKTEIEVETNGSCHVMNLVEGSSIILETANGIRQRFNYAETFAVPAAAGTYKMINEDSNQIAKVVKAFIKKNEGAVLE